MSLYTPSSGVEQDAEDWGEQRRGVVDEEDGMGMLHAHGGGVYMGHSQRPAETVRKPREVSAVPFMYVLTVDDWGTYARSQSRGKTRGPRFGWSVVDG